MLFRAEEVKAPEKPSEERQDTPKNGGNIEALDTAAHDDEFVIDTISKPEGIGLLAHDQCKHYYSSGAFNLIQLVLYVLKQTGPAHVFLCTYSIAERAIQTLVNHRDKGDILSIRFLIDNRVRTISPKPFDFMLNAFPGCTRCRTLHAKVALIWNDEWEVDIVGSQNATHNPKLERGTIYTVKEVFDFDKAVMEDEFNRGTVEGD